MNTCTYLFPGQGSQYPGMGKDFYETYSEAREIYQQADDILGKALSKTIFFGNEQELTQTKVSQPAIFVTSVAILTVLKKQFCLPRFPQSVCGLSLGEYIALVACGCLDFATALQIVARRGRFMHQACEETLGGMKVVLGLTDSIVEQTISSLNMPCEIWCANFNCPGQVVISGTVKGVETAEKALKEKGAKRVVSLDVHGAFHSGLMRKAQEALCPYLDQAPIMTPQSNFAMNVSGTFESDPTRIKNLLMQQVTSSVRWHASITACSNSTTSCFIEMGPGKTLAGMNRKIGVQAPSISIETVDDIALLEKILTTI